MADSEHNQLRPDARVVDAEQRRRVGPRRLRIHHARNGAANRDGTVFPAPADLDLDRPNTRRHLTFGLGPRYCVGATLARLETEELVRALVERYDTLTVTSGPPRFTGFNYRVFEPLIISTRH